MARKLGLGISLMLPFIECNLGLHVLRDSQNGKSVIFYSFYSPPSGVAGQHRRILSGGRPRQGRLILRIASAGLRTPHPGMVCR